MERFKKIISFLFVPILLLTIPFSLAFKSNLTLDEKRTPIPFPTTYSDDYFSRFDEWFNDNVPFRQSIISFYNTIDQAIENAFFNFLLIISGESGFEYSRSGSIEDITDPYLDKGQPYFAPRYNGAVLYGRDGWLFYTGDNALENYKGSDILNDYEMYKLMEKFISISNICKEKNIKLNFSIFPNKEQVYADKMPSIKVTNRAKKLQRIEHYFNKNSDLNFIYPLDILIESRNSNIDTYLKEDTHWNSMGAMIGYSKIQEALGKEAPIYTYEEIPYSGGDLANMVGVGSTYQSYDIKYKEEVSYTVVDDGYRRYVETQSSLSDDSRCLLIGDSFSNALVPYFAKDYEHLKCVHYDYMDSDYAFNAVQELKDGDTLIILSVERLFSSLVNSFAKLSEHLSK